MTVKSLGELVLDLQNEVGMSVAPAAGINIRPQLIYVLNRTQEQLNFDYDWPGLVIDRDIPLSVGTRYYPYASDLPFENVDKVWLIYDTLFGGLPYGIGPNEFVLFNSNTGFQSWPVMRWMHHTDDGTFEVWPVPSEAPPASATTEAARIRMRGTKLIPPMVADSDMCVLPSTAIVLFAAAELSARRGDKNAEGKASKAVDYVRRLRIRQGAAKRGPFVMGGGSASGRGGRIGLDYIPNNYGQGPGSYDGSNYTGDFSGDFR
jgi:hypothetical protein